MKKINDLPQHEFLINAKNILEVTRKSISIILWRKENYSNVTIYTEVALTFWKPVQADREKPSRKFF